MKRNVEIKARVDDLVAVRERAGKLAHGGPVIFTQTDTFSHCARGRLKLRQLADSAEAELIYYERPDETGPRESRYHIYRAADPDSLRATLLVALGVRGVVRKQRTLYLMGPSRIHLDEVEGLGGFVEIEVVLDPEQDTADGAVIAQQLMSKLGIETEQLIDKAYIDLLDAGSRAYEREPK
jgi:predicted adenylyl cyclase CyaB